MARKWGESDSRYLKKEDIGTATPIVTIESASWEEVGEEKDEKPILYFKGKSKGLVCNKTIQDTIVDLFGDPPAQSEDGSHLTRWLRGKQVQLYVDTSVRYAGKRVGGLRIRAASGEQAEPAPEPMNEPPPPDEEFAPAPDAEDIPF